MQNITQKIIEKKCVNLELGDYFIITKGINYSYFGNNCDNLNNIVTEISQGKNGLYIGWLSSQDNIVSTEKFTHIDKNTPQLDYYYNKKKNILINDYKDINSGKIGDKFIFIVDQNGWRIISNNFQDFFDMSDDVQNSYQKNKKIDNEKISDPIFYDLCYYSEIKKEYIPRIYYIEITNGNPEKIVKSIFLEIIEMTFDKIEKNMIKRKILEEEAIEEIGIEIMVKKLIRNEIEYREKIEDDEKIEKKIYLKKRDEQIEKKRNEETKDKILETIKYQTLDLINLYINNDTNIMLKKTIIEMVNKLKPGLIDLKFKEEKMMENIPDIKAEKIYAVKFENKNKNDIINQLSEQKLEILNNCNINKILGSEMIIKFELNDNGEIVISDKYNNYNNLDLIDNNHKFILSVKSAKIWMVGGGCGGNLISGGSGGKNAFYRINTENKIHIENVGRGGNLSDFGEETKIFLENDNKILSVLGGDNYTKNEFGEKVNCSSGITGGNGGNINTSGQNGFIFIKYKT